MEEYAFGGYELGLGWGVGVRKGDSECSDEEEGNWENRWRAVLGLRGIAEVERRSIRCAEAFCGRSVLEGVAGRQHVLVRLLLSSTNQTGFSVLYSPF